jgi:hypothetical protein
MKSVCEQGDATCQSIDRFAIFPFYSIIPLRFIPSFARKNEQQPEWSRSAMMDSLNLLMDPLHQKLDSLPKGTVLYGKDMAWADVLQPHKAAEADVSTKIQDNCYCSSIS